MAAREIREIDVREEWLSGRPQARFARRWWPRGGVAATLVIVHGYAEHGGRYDRFAQRAAAAGIGVLAPDLGGHGRSAGERARVDRLDDLVDDARSALEVLAGEDAPPPFVLGHSMGGLVATALALEEQHRMSGLILSGAALLDPAAYETLLEIEPFPEIVLDSAQLSRDPRVVADYESDPLNHRGPMARATVAALVAGVREVRARSHELTLPLLVLHGSEDGLVPAAGSEELARVARSADKEIAVLAGLRHEVLNEPEGPEIADRIVSWILRRVEGAKAVC